MTELKFCNRKTAPDFSSDAAFAEESREAVTLEKGEKFSWRWGLVLVHGWVYKNLTHLSRLIQIRGVTVIFKVCARKECIKEKFHTMQRPRVMISDAEEFGAVTKIPGLYQLRNELL